MIINKEVHLLIQYHILSEYLHNATPVVTNSQFIIFFILITRTTY